MKKSGQYVDGFVIPIKKKNVISYKRMAEKAGRIWMELGAVQYCECAGDDLNATWGTPFGKLAKAKKDETVLFSWIVYRSKKHRDTINAKIMKDPRILKMMSDNPTMFDSKRMSYGGFKSLVSK